MSSVQELIQSFNTAIEHKENSGNFTKDDVTDIYNAAKKLFDNPQPINEQELMQIRDKFVQLAEGKIDKQRAMKKLQGTSRAEAIQSVLNSML